MDEIIVLHMRRLASTKLDVSTTVITFPEADTDITDRGSYPGLLVLKCQVDPAGGNVRITLDDTDPVGATTGKRYDAGDEFEVTGADIKTAKFLRDATSDAKIWIDAYGSAV